VTTVIVQSLLDYVHAQLLTAEGRAMVADEPHEFDGADFGPTPYELLTWALGACTAMTLQIYARRRKYPLEEVAIEIQHNRVHAADCENCEEPQAGRIEELRRHIILRGELSDEQRDDLLRVAARCPVHKTLKAAPEVVDSIEVVA
jgi:uncharacterized OsmC-like protein